jgi:hypothetical protein
MIRGLQGTLLGVWHWQPLALWIVVANVVRLSSAVPSLQPVAVRAVDCVKSGSGSAFSPRHTRPLRFHRHLCDEGSTHRYSNANSRSNVFAGQNDQPLNSGTGLGIWHALHSSKESYLMSLVVRLATAWLTVPLLVAVGIEFPWQSHSQML